MRAIHDPLVRMAFCSAGELYGGVERHLLGMHTELVRNGVDPAMILFHDRELARQACALGLKVVVLPGWHSYDPRAAWRLADVLARESINLVHAHGYKAMVLCALARHRHRFAVVKTEHGLPEHARRDPINWTKLRVYEWLDNWATRACGATVCYVTKDLCARYAHKHRGLPRQTIYNGIESLHIASTTRPIEYEKEFFHLAVVGRVDAVKGVRYALQAMANPAMPNHVRLNVIGTGPLLSSLQALAATLGTLNRVRFLGFRRNVYDYLAHCDALLMPSLHEGLPYTLLEAMSLGRPIIASRVGGLAEVLQDDRTAILFEPADVNDILDAIIKVVRHPALAAALGEAARQDQRHRFNLATMSKQYWRVYKALAAQESNGYA